MEKITTQFGYHYLKGKGRKNKPIYDLLPDTEDPTKHPESGYYSSGYICRVKGVPNLFEPTAVTEKQVKFRTQKL